MNIITKKNVPSMRYTNVISNMHRVVFPKHSRNLKFKLYENNNNDKVFQVFTKQIAYENFYLNLPTIEFVCELSSLGTLLQVNIHCIFEKDKQYYFPLFPNIITELDQPTSLPHVCMGTYQRAVLNTKNENQIINNYISAFFSTIFDLKGFDTYLYYAFNYYNGDIDISISDVEKLIDYGYIKKANVHMIVDFFKENISKKVAMKLKNIIIYSEWSRKSKENKNYSIFDDFKVQVFELPKNLKEILWTK